MPSTRSSLPRSGGGAGRTISRAGEVADPRRARRRASPTVIIADRRGLLHLTDGRRRARRALQASATADLLIVVTSARARPTARRRPDHSDVAREDVEPRARGARHAASTRRSDRERAGDVSSATPRSCGESAAAHQQTPSTGRRVERTSRAPSCRSVLVFTVWATLIAAGRDPHRLADPDLRRDDALGPLSPARSGGDLRGRRPPATRSRRRSSSTLDVVLLRRDPRHSCSRLACRRAGSRSPTAVRDRRPAIAASRSPARALYLGFVVALRGRHRRGMLFVLRRRSLDALDAIEAMSVTTIPAAANVTSLRPTAIGRSSGGPRRIGDLRLRSSALAWPRSRSSRRRDRGSGMLAVNRGDQRDDQDRDDVRDLDHRVDRRAGGVLVGVTDRVAGDRRRRAPRSPCRRSAPSSISFFALSQAPPPEVIAIARKRPVTIVPISSPPSISG